jgi:hypothetical protein
MRIPTDPTLGTTRPSGLRCNYGPDPNTPCSALVAQSIESTTPKSERVSWWDVIHDFRENGGSQDTSDRLGPPEHYAWTYDAVERAEPSERVAEAERQIISAAVRELATALGVEPASGAWRPSPASWDSFSSSVQGASDALKDTSSGNPLGGMLDRSKDHP